MHVADDGIETGELVVGDGEHPGVEDAQVEGVTEIGFADRHLQNVVRPGMQACGLEVQPKEFHEFLSSGSSSA